MQNIKFSKEFFDLLKKLVTVSKAKSTLMFKEGGRCRITIPTASTFVHLSAGPKDLDFDGDSINISSLSEFVKYAENTGYPEKGEVTVDTEMSISGNIYEYIKFSSSAMTCRTITADPTVFGEMDRLVPVAREKDIMQLAATVYLGDKQLDQIQKALRAVPGCQYVTVVVDDKVHLYLKGKVAQEVVLHMGYPDIKINDESVVAKAFSTGTSTSTEVATTQEAVKPNIHMFQSLFFLILKGLGCQFETEIRYYEEGHGLTKTSTTTIKAFGSIPGSDADDPISVYVGTMESEAMAIANFDLIL